MDEDECYRHPPLTLITSWAARPPMKALMGAKSPRAVKDRLLTAASSSSSSGATAFSSRTMLSRVSASGCKGGERLFFLTYRTTCFLKWIECWLQHPGTFTDLIPRTREPLFFLHKAVEGLESQVQGLVPRYFPKVIHRQQLNVQQSLTHWFLQFILKSS